VVPLLLAEPQRARLLDELERDPVMLVWWGTPVECVSALARREREGALSLADASAAVARLRTVAASWEEVLPSEAVRSAAQRLLRVHALRAADSLQLAAALVAAERDPGSLPLVSLDERLNEAALREGFLIVPG
jgi:predicted nucleic acid-binding protein